MDFVEDKPIDYSVKTGDRTIKFQLNDKSYWGNRYTLERRSGLIRSLIQDCNTNTNNTNYTKIVHVPSRFTEDQLLLMLKIFDGFYDIENKTYEYYMNIFQILEFFECPSTAKWCLHIAECYTHITIEHVDLYLKYDIIAECVVWIIEQSNTTDIYRVINNLSDYALTHFKFVHLLMPRLLVKQIAAANFLLVRIIDKYNSDELCDIIGYKYNTDIILDEDNDEIPLSSINTTPIIRLKHIYNDEICVGDSDDSDEESEKNTTNNNNTLHYEILQIVRNRLTIDKYAWIDAFTTFCLNVLPSTERGPALSEE